MVLRTLFITGPGFQMAQIFIEKYLKTLVDWDEIINNDNNLQKYISSYYSKAVLK